MYVCIHIYVCVYVFFFSLVSLDQLWVISLTSLTPSSKFYRTHTNSQHSMTKKKKKKFVNAGLTANIESGLSQCFFVQLMGSSTARRLPAHHVP